MTPAQPGQLERALTNLTVGLVQGQQLRERILRDGYQGEYEQQVQLQFAGAAGNMAGFTDADITFELPFLYAPAQRHVPFETPHFTYGIELLNAGDTLVQLAAHVTAWNINDSNWVVGATVRLTAVAPLVTTEAVAFAAIAHLRFQGYASYAEGDEYQDG